MSNRAVLISLALALALGVVAMIVLQVPAEREVDGTPVGLLNVPIASVQALELDVDGVRTAVRSGESGWMHEVKRDGVVVERWPVDREQVIAALRLLKSRTLTPSDEVQSGPPKGSLLLRSDGMPIVLIELWPERVGGRMPAMVEEAVGAGVTGWIEGDLGELFLESGFAPWRSTLAIPLGLDDPTRIAITGENGTIELIRQGARWALAEPFEADADPGAVRLLIAALSRLRIERFEPNGLAETIQQPWLEIAVDFRHSDGAARTSLAVGEALDLAGRVHAAQVGVVPIEGGDPVVPTQSIAVVSQGFEELAIDPESLVLRTLVRKPAGEVVRVAYVPTGKGAKRFDRAIGGWRGGTDSAVDQDKTAAVEDVVSWACESPAQRLTRSIDSARRPLGVLGFVLRGGEQIELQLWSQSDGTLAASTGREDGLIRVYTVAERESLEQALGVLSQ